MPKRIRPTSLLLGLALVALALQPRAIAAQTLASATVDVDLRVSPVTGATETLYGGRIWFSISENFRFGGGAWALPSASRSGTLAQSGLELDFGYGGIGLEWRGLPVDALVLRTLLGAGSGTVFDQATGSRVDSESFFLVEPELGLQLGIFSWLHATGSAGWRFSFAADPLTRVNTDDFRSWTVGLGLRFGPF